MIPARTSATVAAMSPGDDNKMRYPLRTLLQATAIGAALCAPPARADLVNENLLVVAPPGYEVGFRDRKKASLITEWVPAGETVNDWTEMVTVQVFYELKVAPEEFMRDLEKRWRAACGRWRSADDCQWKRERLPGAGLAAGLSAQSGQRQARDHLVQGGRGQRQLLRRAEGVQVHAHQGADRPLGRISQGR